MTFPATQGGTVKKNDENETDWDGRDAAAFRWIVYCSLVDRVRAMRTR